MDTNKAFLNEIPNLRYYSPKKFFLIAGPCVVEGLDITLEIAQRLLEICDRLQIPLIFKASYRKANRSRDDSFSGLGDIESLAILREVKDTLSVPIITDIHSVPEAEVAAQVADVLQIPAFLCRQTDLLRAAGQTGRVVNIKKGQFLSPAAMSFAAMKVANTGNSKILLTDRGTMFGYNDLVVDFRGIPQMQTFGYPVVLDVTHSLQQPNLTSGVTGGQPQLIEHMARLGVAAGCDGLFFETHPKPEQALSDGLNMLRLDSVEPMLRRLLKIRETIYEL